MQARKTINFIIVIVCCVCIINVVHLQLNRKQAKRIIFKYDAKKELIKVNSDSTIIIFNNKIYTLKRD